MAGRADQIRDELDLLIKEGKLMMLAEVIGSGQLDLKEITNGREGTIKIGSAVIGRVSKEDLAKVEDITAGSHYQNWYTRALPAIRYLLPDRLTEFQGLYKLDKRKDVDYETYTISDYLIGLVITRTRGLLSERLFDPFKPFIIKFSNQISILESARTRLSSALADIRGILQAELFDDELSAARELLKHGHLRAAGMVAGVTLEGHLKEVSLAHGIKLSKKEPGVNDWNEALKNQNFIDTANWRFIQFLADIRNRCGHPKDREPTKEEVRDLIDGTQKIIKTIS